MIAQQPLRALEVHSDLPRGCTPYPVPNNRSAPHLRAGEIAIVDLSDRTPVHGELYLISYRSPLEETGERLVVVMVYGALFPVLRYGKYEPELRWSAVAYDRSGTSEGPFRPGCIERKLVGRIVGIYQPAFEEPRRIAATGGAR